MACNYTFEETVKLLKEAVDQAGGKIRRNDMLSYLVTKSANGKGIGYKDAQEITDFYFDIVKKKFKDNVNSDNKLSNLQKKAATEYFNNNDISFNDNDFSLLEHIWGQADKAISRSEKSTYNEHAQNFIERKESGYNNRIIETLIWTKPLESVVFSISSLRSNIAAITDRGLTEAFTKNGIDFNALTKAFTVDREARLASQRVLQGGVPVTNIVDLENNKEAMSRVEEFSIKPTNAAKGAYLKAAKVISKIGARPMNAIDVIGAVTNANKIYYSLYKNKLKTDNPSLSNKDIEQLAYDHTYKVDRIKAHDDAVQMYKNLGEYKSDPVEQKKFENTARFKLAVEELSKTNRDEELMKRAYQYSKNDFWKKRMVVKNDLGFGDNGIGGVIAQFSNGSAQLISDSIMGMAGSVFPSFKDQSKKSIAGDLVKQRVFGYINGASAFLEDKLEHFIVYGAIKGHLLGKQKGRATEEVVEYIERRQKDFLAKGILGMLKGAIWTGVAALAENVICDDLEEGKAIDIRNTPQRIGFSICGYRIPIAMADQDKIMFDAYQVLTQGSGGNLDFLSFIIQEAIGNNRYVGGTALEQLAEHTKKSNSYEEQGNEASAQREKDKNAKVISDEIANYFNSFLPVPQRLLKEVKLVVGEAKGIGESPQFKAQGLVDQFRHSMVNAMGFSDLYQLSGAEHPVYDYQDRFVFERTGDKIRGDRIKYNKVDDMLATLHIRPPYTDRFTLVKSEVKKENGVKTTVKRYLTDDEFYQLSRAKSQVVKEYFEGAYDILKKEDPELAKAQINKVFDGLWRNGMKYFSEKETSSIEEIKKYLQGAKRKKVTVNKTVLQEEE